MHSASNAASGAPLTPAQTGDVLRYWLLALRLEEALQVRPQARRPSNDHPPVRLDAPMPGQDYFKLPLGAELGALVASDTALALNMDGELSRFFETWLHTQYRRGQDDGELSHLLCFPVVHLPRGELAGLLRMGVRIAFGKRGGSPFRVPTRVERQLGQYPAIPDEARVTVAPRGEGQWPFFVDTRLMRHPLGVSHEGIDCFFEALRAREDVSPAQMMALMVALLESNLRSDQCENAAELARLALDGARLPVDALLTRLTEVMGELLRRASSRAKAFPVGIVVDGTQAKTTWHLQRDLNSLLDKPASAADASALGAYLTGSPIDEGQGLQRALFDGPALTTQQRIVAERFWGSRLSSVQGPPGTGKTTLILHLCAEALVRQVEAFVDRGSFADAPFVVTSSNNRAVDNVVDPLTQRRGLPLALRVGNRQVCETTLLAQLGRTLVFLEETAREPHALRKDALAHAVEEFKRARAALDQLFAPRTEAERRKAEHARLSAALSELTSIARTKSEAEVASEDGSFSEHAGALLEALVPLERRLVSLSELCEAKPGLLQVNAVARHYGRTAKRELAAFEAALLAADLSLDLPLPPLVVSMDVAELMAAWEDATEICLTRLAELRERLERVRATQTRSVEIARLRRELEVLGPVPEVFPEVIPDDALSYALFAAAVRVREAWAKVNAQTLHAAVETALSVVRDERSLRPLFRSDPHSATMLRRLFGIWGSTLLSLGNTFPPEPLSIAQVVIDEAGQCHPAHAVSALLRAETALVLGDVHQLAPVVELGQDDEARLLKSSLIQTPSKLLLPYRIHSEAWTSAQTLADRAVSTRGKLIDHFRCQPEIIAVSDALCDYGLTVHTPRAQRSEELPWLTHPLMLMDLRGEQERLAGSLCNELELQHALDLVVTILRAGIPATDLAVITPYRGQLERLYRGFAERRIPVESTSELAEDRTISVRSGVALGTVHRFQGGERSIVLFSSVVSRSANLSFLNARPNLLNVAISRAQHHFIALGHREVLALGPRTRLLTTAARVLEPRSSLVSSRHGEGLFTE